MPKIITIIFECYPPLVPNIDPSRVGEGKRCADAYEDLLDYLHEHHISYYHLDVKRDEMRAEEERLISLKAKEYAP